MYSSRGEARQSAAWCGDNLNGLVEILCNTLLKETARLTKPARAPVYDQRGEVVLEVAPLVTQVQRLEFGLRLFDCGKLLVALDGVAIEACRHQVLLRIITSALGSRLEMVNDEIAPSLKRIANVSTVDAPEAIPSKNPRVSIYFSYRRHLCIPLRQILRPD